MSRRQLGAAYQGALEAALAVVISAGIGIWADSYFDTSPGFLLAGLGIGFGAFIWRLVKLSQELSANQAPPKNEENQEQSGTRNDE